MNKGAAKGRYIKYRPYLDDVQCTVRDTVRLGSTLCNLDRVVRARALLGLSC